MKLTAAFVMALFVVGSELISGLNVAATAPTGSNSSTLASEGRTMLSAEPVTASVDVLFSLQRKPDSLCDASERVLFSALVKGSNKLVTICSSRKIDKEQGYLQYRFGRPRQVELEFPSSRQDTQKAFTYTRYTRPRVTYLTVKFTSNGYSYSLHQDYNDETKPAENEAYLVVAPVVKEDDEAAKKVIHLQRTVKGSLSSLEDLVPNEDWNDSGK